MWQLHNIQTQTLSGDTTNKDSVWEHDSYTIWPLSDCWGVCYASYCIQGYINYPHYIKKQHIWVRLCHPYFCVTNMLTYINDCCTSQMESVRGRLSGLSVSCFSFFFFFSTNITLYHAVRVSVTEIYCTLDMNITNCDVTLKNINCTSIIIFWKDVIYWKDVLYCNSKSVICRAWFQNLEVSQAHEYTVAAGEQCWSFFFLK